MNNLKTKVIYSTSYDPWYNLALEEYLLKEVGKREAILYLWQNQNTVVIGRNQNAWKECRIKLLEDEGGKLARRLSGGGAVFHDLGNLNFTFVVDRDLYDLEKQLQVILQAVKSKGIDAKFSGRNDLIANERKFSGNAFYYTTNSAYHHGTILVNSDFNKLVRYLQVSGAKIKSKGIDSVRSRVINLKELNEDLTIEEMKEAMKESFINLYNDPIEVKEINPEEHDKVQELYEKYSSWEWRLGQTPDFDIIFENRFDWGGIELGINYKNGYIKGVKIYSDAMEAALIQEISSVLKGVPYKLDEILKSIDSVSTDKNGEKIIDDIKDWLEKQSI